MKRKEKRERQDIVGRKAVRQGGGQGRKKRKREGGTRGTRGTKEETGKWINRSQVDGLVSTSRDGGTIENRMFLLGLERT